jgi:hypothetical protein
MHLFAFLFACQSTIFHRSKNSVLGQKKHFSSYFFPKYAVFFHSF